jgi:hypothetical protein
MLQCIQVEQRLYYWHVDELIRLHYLIHPFSHSRVRMILRQYRISTINTGMTVHPLDTKHPNQIGSSSISVPKQKSSLSSIMSSSSQTWMANGSKDKEDPFYRMLCDRVSQTLLVKHNFHPIHDRVATWQRTIYYASVTVAVICCAIQHSQVRAFFFLKKNLYSVLHFLRVCANYYLRN